MTEIHGDSPAAAAQPQATDNGVQAAMNRPDVQKALAGLKSVGWVAKDNQPSKKQKIFAVVMNFIQFVPIVIGAIFIKDCPVEPMIPIWLIVNGAMTFISGILELFVVFKGEQHTKIAGLSRLIHVFLPIWFIVGCVYVYRNYEPDYIAPVGGIIAGETYEYCHQTVYLTAFWSITIYFILAAVALFCCCCCCVCGGVACCAKIGLSMNNKTDVENVTPGQIEAASEKA